MCIGTIIVKTLHKKVQGFDQEMQELDDVWKSVDWQTTDVCRSVR